MFDVVGIDSPCIDLAVNVKNFPKPNGGQLVENCSWQGGGKVATGMVASARLGAKCAIIGNVGDDRYGSFCVKDFERHGIDTRYMLQRENETTHFSLVISDKETGGRSIIFYPGTSKPIREQELPMDYLTNTKYFFLSAVNDVTERAAEIARGSGAQVVIDADTYEDRMMEPIGLIDVFIGSEFVYDALFDDKDYEKNCRSLMEKGPRIVVFTFGGEGCAGVSSDGYFRLPAYNVEVSDTVGAGDVFHGAYIAALLQGWSAEESARFSSAVSAIKCTRIGGRAGIPDRKTALDFMRTGVIDYTEIDRRVEYYKRGIDHV